MRVLHVFKTYLPDHFAGVERVIWQIVEATHALGTQSTVLFLSTKQSGPATVAHHATFAARRELYVASTGLSFSVFGAFRELVAEHDIVHYHFPWPLMDLLEFAHQHGKPRLVTYHSDIVRQRQLARLYAPLMHGFLGRVESVVATSPHYLASSPVLARHSTKTKVIPIGIQDVADPDPLVVDAWQRRIGCGFFLFVGALRYYKGLPFLIEAAREAGLKIVVAGEGEMASDLAEAGLTNLIAVGAVEEADKLALLSLCTAFVFPSHLRSEAFGVALLEAARAGKPMISCDMGTGTSYINLHQVTGLAVAPGDGVALANAMRSLWQAPDMVRAMGKAARQRYLDLFTSQQMGRAYQDEYNALVQAGAVLPGTHEPTATGR